MGTAASRAKQRRADIKSGKRKAQGPTSGGGGGGSSSQQIGLNDSQIDQLRGLGGIDQGALNNYVSSGSNVGGSNNPNGRGREAFTPESANDPGVYTNPTQPPTGYDINSGVINAGMGDTNNPYQDGMFQFPDITAGEGAGESESAAASSLQGLGQYIEGIVGQAKPDEGAFVDAFRDTREELRIQEIQDARNRQANIINEITSNRDAEILGLEGQGRGITESIIGGQQARISREAAILALPHQALLAAAQGDLDTANALLGQLYQAKSADITAQQQYKSTLVNSAIQFANTAQQGILAGKQADIARDAATAQSNLTYQRQLGMKAMEYEQGGLVTAFAALDPSSPTFEQDIGALASGLKEPKAAGTQKAPTLQNFGTATAPDWRQFNYSTGQWEQVEGIGGASTINEVKTLASLNRFQENISGIISSPALNSTVGTNFLTRTDGTIMGRITAGIVGTGAGAAAGSVVPGVGNLVGAGIGLVASQLPGTWDRLTGERQDFLSDVHNLTSNLTLDKLAEAKAEGITFGALSKDEWVILAASAQKITDWEVHDGDGKVIGYNISEKIFLDEMDEINKWKAQDALYSNVSWQDIQGVDYDSETGTYWYRNNDGSADQLIY